jgi:nitric oxide reductase activation protein
LSTLRQKDTDLTRFYALFPQPALARDLFNLVEGHRVDALLGRAYPGIRRDMGMILAQTAGRRPEIATLPDAQALVEVLLQLALGVTADLEELAPALRPVAERAIALLDEALVEGASVADAARLTAALYELIDEAVSDWRREFVEERQRALDELAEEGRSEQDQQPPQQAPGASDLSDYESLELPPFMTPVLEELVRERQKQQPPQPGAPPGEREQRPPEGEEAQDPDGHMTTSEVERGIGDDDEAMQASGQSAEEEAPPGRAADARMDDAEGGGGSPLQEGLAEVPLVEDEGDEEEDLGEQVFSYDEWDHKIEDYRPGWCTLRESRSTRSQEGFVAATFHEFGGIVSQIRRNFQLMRPERLRKMRHQREGDDLDVDGLVEYVVDRRARVTPTERVYVKREKRDRDVTTAFLVDMSSSTDRKIDGRKRIIDIEKEALLLMCEALEAIRDEYAIYGFSGSGRDDCQFYVVKEIGERYDERVRARIGGIYGRQKTRMGPALRHATRRLMGVDSNIKLLILLTDGKPYDSDTYQDNVYAQEDTKVALREARREKIHLFCVTVDREAADYLPHMYSDANFVIIDDVRTLPQKLPQLYRRLTT